MDKRRLYIAAILVSILTSCVQCSHTPSLEDKIERVETGYTLRDAKGHPRGDEVTLPELIAAFNVPGVSIAIVDDFKIVWAKGYGVLEAGGSESVTPGTLFQTASIGKPVTAVTALHFVEQRHLELDENVNDRLVSWLVPENAFTAQEKVTLRRLLSHTAGVTVHGFDGYTQGQTIPTLQQILDGESPANNAPVHVDTVPGTEWRYSGGSYTIVQQLLEDVVDKPFPDIVQEVLFDPLGMTSTVYAAPLPEALRDRAATSHTAFGRPPLIGKWHEYPEFAAAGPWSTPSDLARFAVEIMLSRKGKSNKVLSREMVRQMLTVQFEGSGYGLGFELANEFQSSFRFAHAGYNAPGFVNILMALPESGQGVVIMTNGSRGYEVIDEILPRIAAEFEWPGSRVNVTVSVEDDHGNPVSGAAVTSTFQPLGQDSLSGGTDSDGLVTFTDARIGQYAFQASMTGFTTGSDSIVKPKLGKDVEVTIVIEK